MYYPNPIEDICYSDSHIEQVYTEIKANFYEYYNKFIETDGGIIPDSEQIAIIAEHFGILPVKKKKRNINIAFTEIINKSIEDFKKDRSKYIDILNLENLIEYRDDPSFFKGTILKNQCPIIHAIIQHKSAKELDKYRRDFQLADPNHILEVVINISTFAHRYKDCISNPTSYETIKNYKELQLSELLEEKYVEYGVIGGGIRSHFLYKLYPNVFPNRSSESIWALWYLTNKKHFDCKQDSEFLIIDKIKNITQQNYFYPYDLFSFYALNIFLMLKKAAEIEDIKLPLEYRYVILDSFLNFITHLHNSEISSLKEIIKEDKNGY